MTVYAFRRLSLLVALALLALLWAQPTGAFDFAQTGARDVTAAVVSDATAYNAISGGTCTGVPTLGGGTCTFTISNLATTGQNFTVTKTADAGSKVSSYRVTGAANVASGGVTTPSEISVGSSTTLTANLVGCLCTGSTFDIYWQVNGAQGFVLDSERTLYKMSVRYGV